MSSPFRTPEFLELKNKWYEKLKKKGFNDIEQDEEHLKQWSSYFKIKYHKTTFEAREEYYRLAGKFLHDNKFKSKTDFFIWNQHSSGATMAKIKDRLKEKGIVFQFNKIHEVIHRLAKEMVEKACL